MLRNKCPLSRLEFTGLESSWSNLKSFFQQYGFHQYFHVGSMVKGFTLLHGAGFTGHEVLFAICKGPAILPENAHVIITSAEDINMTVSAAIEKKVNMLGLFTPKIMEFLDSEPFKNADDLRPDWEKNGP